MVVLGGLHLAIGAASPAESIAARLQGGLVDLAVGLDDVDVDPGSILKKGDSLSASVLTHDRASVGEDLDKRGRSGGGHGESLVIGEPFATLFVDLPA